jgi:hypothetical protein
VGAILRAALVPLLHAMNECTTMDTKMFCFAGTFTAKLFKGTSAFSAANKRCLHLLGNDVKKCAITELQLHTAFSRPSSSQKFVVKRQAVLDECHICAAKASGHICIAPLPTMAPTLISDYVSPCVMKCAAITNKQFRRRAFSHVCSTAGPDVCGVVKKETGEVPKHYKLDEHFRGEGIQNINWNACFCLRHCHHRGGGGGQIGAPV